MKLVAEASLEAGKNRLPEHVAAVAAQHGLEVLGVDAMAEAQDLAGKLIGGGIAAAERFELLQAHFGASIFGLWQDGKLVGLLSAFPLNAGGHDAVERGTFDAVALDTAFVAHPGETPAAYYGWGFAASNKDGARAVLRASVDIHRLLYWAVPTYARAVTEDGVRALQSIGFRPHARGAGLFHIPAAERSL